MEKPGTGNSGNGDKDQNEWWKAFEHKNKETKNSKDDVWPEFTNPADLFAMRNENAKYIKAPKTQFKYNGTHKRRLKELIDGYDQKFRGGDQYLENTSLGVEQLRNTAIGKLALARDELMAFLFSIYTNRDEWQQLQISGFLQLMIRVAQGETCNNELAAKLRTCLHS